MLSLPRRGTFFPTSTLIGTYSIYKQDLGKHLLWPGSILGT